MKYVPIILLLFALPLSSSSSQATADETELFLARIVTAIDLKKESDITEARKIGRRHGFEAIRKLQSYSDVYIGRRISRKKRGIEDEIVAELMLDEQVQFLEKLYKFRRYKRASIEGNGRSGKTPIHVWNLIPSMRIKEAWLSGFNASKVTVAIIDDGVDIEHVDLKSAFSPEVSFDFVKFGTLPTPIKSAETQHGTQCAGLVSMEGVRCGLGVGHGATLGAIRLLGPDFLNDALEGDALAFQKDMIDIYSSSWGPMDDGKTAEKPAFFTQEAFANGVKTGRNGKGNVFVWASGNGGSHGDNCALDGYVSNEYTISFGVITSSGNPAPYAEGCSSVLSAVSGGDAMIQTTGLSSTCSVISGSSASAAIASGIIALALEANPSLTQRDIQHLIVHSSNFSEIHLTDRISQNAAGLKFHNSVGFGLLDAQKMVETALKWKNVKEQRHCEVTSSSGTFDFSNCDLQIERVVINASLFSRNRGRLRLLLQSPSGTLSEILPVRSGDLSSDLVDWDFVSVHFWGESAKGGWKLMVEHEEKLPVKVEVHKFRVTGF